MKEQFVTYEIAKLLKELGFNEPCMKYIYTGNTAVNIDTYHECLPRLAYYFNKEDMCISIPLWQQVIDWLREKYDYHICSIPLFKNSNIEKRQSQIHVWKSSDKPIIFDRNKTINEVITEILNHLIKPTL
jgi:hypothetical protein